MTQITGFRPGASRFPHYDAAALGFSNYWYPVMRSAQLGRRPVALHLFGEPIVFARDAGKPSAQARHDSFGGETSVRSYAVAERLGLVWIYNGTGEPPPVERDIPAEMLRSDAVIEGRTTMRTGDWRHAAENGFDEGHAKYLHRSALIMCFTRMPGYSSVVVGPDTDAWITRKPTFIGWEAEFPGLGTWPKRRFWQKTKPGSRISIRMPGLLRVNRGNLLHFEWYVPTVAGAHRYLQFAVQFKTGLPALGFRLYYWLWFRWIFHVLFNDQDASMVELMKTPPERLYRPDISLIAWRHLCEREVGGAERTVTPTAEDAYRAQELEQTGAGRG